jgi:hypothetical protein
VVGKVVDIRSLGVRVRADFEQLKLNSIAVVLFDTKSGLLADNRAYVVDASCYGVIRIL